MLTRRERTYLEHLSQVKHIQRILVAFSLDDSILASLLEKLSGVSPNPAAFSRFWNRLDTTNSNFRGDTFCDLRQLIPPDLAKELADHDRIRTHLAKIFSSQIDLTCQKRANRLYACQQAHLLFSNVLPEARQKTTVIPYACNSRFCPACSREKSRRTYNRVVDTLGPLFESHQMHIQWITLTIQNPPAGSLASGVKDLQHAFRRLRRPHEMNGKRGRQWNCWTESVRGYLHNLEVSFNPSNSSWHPHIHIIYSGDFIPWRDLKSEWSKALRPTGRKGDIKIGEAYYVDAHGNKHSCSSSDDARDILECFVEVTKYTLKPFESDIPPARILELTDALFNKRLFGSGGDFLLPPEQLRDTTPYWSLEGGLAACLEDSDSILSDIDYWDSCLKSCESHHKSWLLIVRNYAYFYWVCFGENHPDS